MADASSINPIPVGLDDGYAFTKIALPDGRLSRFLHVLAWAVSVTWIHEAEQRISEYETEDTVYSVGAPGRCTHAF